VAQLVDVFAVKKVLALYYFKFSVRIMLTPVTDTSDSTKT